MKKCISIATILVVLFANIAMRQADADLSMLLAADGSPLDTSGNGNDGTLVNGTSYATGKVGQAFSFDGIDDYITVAASSNLESTDFFSIAMWVQTPDKPGLKILADNSHGSSNGANGWALQLDAIGRVSFAYGNRSAFPEISSVKEIDNNTFRHVAATYDGSSLNVYIDGILDGTTAYTGTPSGTGQEIRIGRHFALNRQFTGQMDDIRIYDSALTASEVASLAAIPEPASIVILTMCGIGCLIRRNR